jgi:integrase
MSNASIKAKKFAINSFDKFSKEEFDIESAELMIQDMKKEEDIVLYDVLQKWINWETITDVKNRFSHLNGYLYYHGIKISTQDVRYNLQFTKTKKREQYPVKLEEIQDILNPAPYFKKALYLALISSGMRIGGHRRAEHQGRGFSE